MDHKTLKTLVSMTLILSITCLSASLYSQNNRVSLDDTELLDIDFTTPTVAQPSAPTYTLTEAENLNRLYATWKAQLDALVSNIQHLAQLVDANKVTPANKYEARVWLGQLSALINQTTRLPYAPLTPHKLIRFFTFNKILIKALTNAFTSNLTTLPALEQLEGALEELTVALKTPTRTNLPISAVTAYAKETQQTTAALTYKIGNAGITWYNTVWRSIGSVNKNLHLWDVAAFTTGAAALTALTLMILPKETVKDVPLFGPAKEVVDLAKAPFEPYVDPNAAQYKSLSLAVATVNAGAFLHNLGLFTKLSQTWSDVDAFLKGTTNDSYQKFIQYVDDFTLEEQMFDSVRHLFEPFNAILKFLEDPDFYIRSNMKISKCILLSGTPGSGKTHSARALAGSINKLFTQLNRFEKAGFIEVEPWDLGQIEEVIKQAKANAPCVIFIDEFHLFGGGAQINTNAMWLSKLLTEIDKVDKANDPMQQIFIVAATNRPDLLAQALLRHGRFGERIEFPIPDLQQRTSVFKALCQKSAVDTTHIDLNHLAQLTQGASFSTISKIFERAGFIAKQHAQGITYNHLYQALNEVLRGLNARVNMSESEKEIIAVHLAGIALAHLALETPAMLDAITLQMPRRKIVEGLEFMSKMENTDENKQHATHYGTFYTYNSYEHIVPFTVDKFITSKLLLAGIMAQNVILGGESSYGLSDRALAYEGAVTVALKGHDMNKLSKKEQNNAKDKAFAAIAQCEAELLKLFTEQKETLRLIADELKAKEFLAVHEIKALINK